MELEGPPESGIARVPANLHVLRPAALDPIADRVNPPDQKPWDGFLVWVARPVLALSRTAEGVRSGDLSSRAAPGGGGETHRLAITFNAMIDGQIAKLTDRAQATSGEAVLAIERRGEQLTRWMMMTEALADESAKVAPAIQQQKEASETVKLGIQLIADTSRTLVAAAQQVAETAAAEASVAELASHGWDQERHR